jgi:N-carbamoylputrescine amidase
VKLAIVQFKPRKGDVEANLAALGNAFAQLSAEEKPYDLIVLPEAALTGYFLEGAVYELAFPAETLAERLARLWRECSARPVDVSIGFFENNAGTYHNSAMYLHVAPKRHRIVHVHRKMFLPTYGVFDEERFLSRGRRLQAFDTRFGRMALLICEDMWHALMPTIAAIKGARALIVPSASPGRGIEGREGQLDSVRYWHELLHASAVEHGVFIFYAGLAGFEGGKGMTGSSRVVDPRGETLAEAPALGACVIRAEIDFGEVDLARASLPLLGDLGAVLPDLLIDDEVLPLTRAADASAKRKRDLDGGVRKQEPLPKAEPL